HQNHMFSYLSPEERVRKDHPRRAIRVMVDEVLRQLSRRFDSMYASVGRPSIPPDGRALHRRWHAAGSVGGREKFSSEGQEAIATGRSGQSHRKLSWRAEVERNA